MTELHKRVLNHIYLKSINVMHIVKTLSMDSSILIIGYDKDRMILIINLDTFR